jgi:hypothetical protein
MTRKLSLVCGIVSSLLYVGMNVLVPMQWDGYSSGLKPSASCPRSALRRDRYGFRLVSPTPW